MSARCSHHARVAQVPCARCGSLLCDWCVKLAPSWGQGLCPSCQHAAAPKAGARFGPVRLRTQMVMMLFGVGGAAGLVAQVVQALEVRQLPSPGGMALSMAALALSLWMLWAHRLR